MSLGIRYDYARPDWILPVSERRMKASNKQPKYCHPHPRLLHSAELTLCHPLLAGPLKRPFLCLVVKWQNWVSLNALWTLLHQPYPPFISAILFLWRITSLATKCAWIEHNSRSLMCFGAMFNGDIIIKNIFCHYEPDSQSIFLCRSSMPLFCVLNWYGL